MAGLDGEGFPTGDEPVAPQEPPEAILGVSKLHASLGRRTAERDQALAELAKYKARADAQDAELARDLAQQDATERDTARAEVARLQAIIAERAALDAEEAATPPRPVGNNPRRETASPPVEPEPEVSGWPT